MAETIDVEMMVLENWKKERAELDAAIAVLEKKIQTRSGSAPVTAGNGGQIGPDEFFRLSTPDAVKKFLKIVGKPARSTTDIIEGLKRGGLSSTNYTNVYTALGRLKAKGEVVKVGENWGLDEWYPPAPSGPLRLKSILANFQQDGIPLVEAPGEVSEPEQNESEAAALSRKDVVANFIDKNGPSTRAGILAGTGIPKGTLSYCLNDKHRFVQGENGKWRNVE
jgi:hypothetical protein